MQKLKPNITPILFARADSIYKSIPGCDVWCIERDARAWWQVAARHMYYGPPIVAHPPCRAWGRLRQFARPRPDEKALAIMSVWALRKYGGVLEHPAYSTLWPTMGLPTPGQPADKWGGSTLEVRQFDWYHKAAKLTWLYIVGGCDVLPMPVREDTPKYVVTTRIRKGEPGWLPDITKSEREHSPPLFAMWLVSVARSCVV